MTADWYPGADARPMPYADTMPYRQDRAVLGGHTNGGGTDNGSLYGWFSRPGNTTCSHFQITWSGHVEQYMPLSRQAYAQYAGNPFVISVECQDDGDPGRPMPDAMLGAISGIADWASIPAGYAGEYGSPAGWAWHSKYASWNKSGHECPGGVRIAQWQELAQHKPPLTPATLEGIDPMMVITMSNGTNARLVSLDSAGALTVYAVMSAEDRKAFEAMAPCAVSWNPLPTADYNHLVSTHGR